VFAIKALGFMNTNYFAALWTSPPFNFVSDEMSYAELPDFFEIVDHAHAIFGSIPLIQMVQPCARKAVTSKAILDFCVHDLLTVLDMACKAGF
jgi:hypothetical protein